MALIQNSDLTDGVYTNTTNTTPGGASGTAAPYILVNNSGSKVDVTFTVGAGSIDLYIIRLDGQSTFIAQNSSGSISLDGDETVFVSADLGATGATRTFRISRVEVSHGSNEFRPGRSHVVSTTYENVTLPPGLYIDRIGVSDDTIPNS